SRGIALATWSGSNSPSALSYALTASAGQIGFYSAARQRKFSFVPKGGEATALIAIEPNPESHEQKFNLKLAGGVSGKEGGLPFELHMDLSPAAFLQKAHDKKLNYSLQNGVLWIRGTNADNSWEELKVDAGSGRLLQGLAAFEQGIFRVHGEEGAF